MKMVRLYNTHMRLRESNSSNSPLSNLIDELERAGIPVENHVPWGKLVVTEDSLELNDVKKILRKHAKLKYLSAGYDYSKDCVYIDTPYCAGGKVLTKFDIVNALENVGITGIQSVDAESDMFTVYFNGGADGLYLGTDPSDMWYRDVYSRGIDEIDRHINTLQKLKNLQF